MHGASRATATAAAITVLVAATTSGSTASSQAATRRIVVDQAFPQWRAQRVLTIPESALDAEVVTAMTVSPTGTVLAVDARALHIIALDSTGRNRYTVGQRGTGPGEFRGLNAVGWLGDTLVVLDRVQRRLSVFAGSPLRLARTVLWPTDTTFGRPDSVLTAGDALFAVVTRRTGAPTQVLSGRGMALAPPSRHFAPLTASAVAGTALPHRDSTGGLGGHDCLDTRGTIHILGPIVRDHGSMRAMTAQGDLVAALRDSFALVVHSSDPTRGRTLIIRAHERARLTNAMWDSLAARYVQVTRTAGSVTCTPAVTRPTHLPVIRAIATDERSRLWVEATEPAGAFIYVLTTAGVPIGRFAMPQRDPRIAWAVRGDRLYVVEADDDGLQSIHVYRVGP